MSEANAFLTTVDEEAEDESELSVPNPLDQNRRPSHDPGIVPRTVPHRERPSGIEANRNIRKSRTFTMWTSRQSQRSQTQTIGTENSVATPKIQAGRSKRSGVFSKLSFGNGGSLDDNILNQSALRRSSVRTTGAPRQPLGARAVSSTLVFAKRNAPPKPVAVGAAQAAAAAVHEQDKARAAYRRYRVGDSVLVCNTLLRMTNFVNRYGYPAGGGVTPEEQRGPYIYVLATVKKVHFEEDAEYYTVTRVDTGMDQRADAEWMEPPRTARGEAAALRAATESQSMNQSDRGLSQNVGPSTTSRRKDRKIVEVLEAAICFPFTPFFWLGECFVTVVGKRLYPLIHKAIDATRRQGRLFLNGMMPYSFSIRITAVNILVLCSAWYMFIDQARLAFFSPEADYPLAIVSLIVWLILVVELLFEVFIRPDGYKSLITTEKAYSPTTVRFINSFHLLIETLALAVFIPQFLCIWSSSCSCGDRPSFSYFNAVYMAVLGPNRSHAFFGRAYIALVKFRVFGLVRHWKKMWINNTFLTMRWKGRSGGLFPGVFVPIQGPGVAQHLSTNKKDDGLVDQLGKGNALINASNIGTALMVTNSHRSLIIFCAIMGFFPLLSTLNTNGGTNRISVEMTRQLQSMNLEFANASSREECTFFLESVSSWVTGLTGGGGQRSSKEDGAIYLLHLAIEPVRCDAFFPWYDGNVTSSFCRSINTTGLEEKKIAGVNELCAIWQQADNVTISELAELARVRTGAIAVEIYSDEGVLTASAGETLETFRVVAKFNQTFSIAPAALSSFLLQVCLLICVLGGLSVLRRDSGVLVLGPLRRMLKIVAQYAKNPLSTVKTGKDDDSDEEGSESGDGGHPEDKLGNYETEQLISAVSKITDLLRKCWGVAGADIISTNLATQEGALTEVFNPTVPGKSVYALFGFAAINDFDHTLRQLGGEVMILINDVAAVLHGEVFRWGFGDSGQCNKNLGAAFLMVFRIGLVKEVIQKLEQATDVVFSSTTSKKSGVRKRNRNATKLNDSSGSKASLSRTTNDRRRKSQRTVNSSRAAMSLSLQSLPGISIFTDRAVIGMLKSFAGIYRDNKLLGWKNDFRLGAGVGAFSVNMIFGMDAGWAVEGAVGSEYKIDATYLSPHVNMASRMMSACKQYGVSILLSQAVQELMSDTARSKLRHLDTVTVKGSSLKQKIFTYDARHKGVDFFLFSRSDEQADLDSDRYSPNVWNVDQDLTAMRQHVTEDFEKEFNKGRDAYLAGDWPKAMKHLTSANEIMVETVMDQGYIQDELNELQNRILDGEDARAAEEELRTETGDGPSRRLITFMESEGRRAPDSWKGYRPLTSK